MPSQDSPADIPQEALELFDGTNFASVATLMPDGTPQVTPVWIDRTGSRPRFNTVQGRLKAENLLRDPRVTVTVFDATNPYRYVQIQGHAELVEEGAEDHIDRLAKKYLDVDTYPKRQEGDRRVSVIVNPERVDFKAA